MLVTKKNKSTKSTNHTKSKGPERVNKHKSGSLVVVGKTEHAPVHVFDLLNTGNKQTVQTKKPVQATVPVVEQEPRKKRSNKTTMRKGDPKLEAIRNPPGQKVIRKKKGCTSFKKFLAYLATLSIKQLKKESIKPQASMRRSMYASMFFRLKAKGDVRAFTAISDRLLGTPVQRTVNKNINDNKNTNIEQVDLSNLSATDLALLEKIAERTNATDNSKLVSSKKRTVS